MSGHFQKGRFFSGARMSTDHQQVLDYWFTELTPKAWFTSSPEVDGQVRDRFLHLHEAAAKGECYWIFLRPVRVHFDSVARIVYQFADFVSNFCGILY